MQVKEVMAGAPTSECLAHFTGRLVIDSRQAYDRLRAAFEPHGARVYLRREGQADHVLAVAAHRISPSRPIVNVLLFLGTCATVVLAGLGNAAGYNLMLAPQTGPPGIELARDLPLALVFAASLLGILVSHEFGHYIAARIHKTAVTLPYFLPFPASYLGTLGAFIQLKEPPRDRRALLDIGLSGPLAGFVVAVPLLLAGLALSPVGPLPASPAAARGLTLEGNSILYLLAKWLVKGQLLPAPESLGGVEPLIYWLRYVLLGRPLPFGGVDVQLHPMAWAGWSGFLVTALNLIPAGQLDGGHLVNVLLGRRAQVFTPFLIVGLLALGLVWSGWWFWAVLIFAFGRVQARAYDEITPLDPTRRVLAFSGLLLFLLLFTPVPLTIF
jgi:membrane-associated protease RseP (regulator of RpoE activity)